MKRIIFATGNQGKMDEIRSILADLDVELLSMKEAGIEVEIVEDGSTFEENALIKAKAVASQISNMDGVTVLADDLNKEPGIYSARYMGEEVPYEIKNQNILERLNGVPKQQRTARFVCAIAAVLPEGETLVVRETVEGYIGWEPAGENGFGYDPIFYLEEYNCTTAQLPSEQKNQLSHRGKALRVMKEKLADR